MRITELLDIRSIALDAAPKSKQETLDAAVALMVKSGKITDEDAYRAQVYAREEESTTGIGEGIAIPHGKCDAVNKPGLAAMVIPNGVDFDSLDGEPVTLLFLIAAPNTKDNVHLDVLSKLSMMLMDEEFTKSLRNARTPEEFLAIIDRADEEKKSVDERLAEPVEAKENQVKILAVTSCPTGIAHTYMAAEGIEKAAKAKGCFVKVETRGSGGAKNVLTAQEIADADCIIVAADAQVPMDRFDGKKVIQRQVSDGISKADELIELAMSGNAPVYKSGNAQTAAASTKKNSGGIGHQLYTQLMNGVSHMLPFVVGGGILIAIAFLIDGLLVDMNSLDAAARSNFGTITPAAAMFKQIGGVAFGFMLPVLAGYIAMAIGDRPALALGFVGGMMATAMNALAVADGLENCGLEVRVQTAISMPQVAEPYIRNKAMRHFEKGRVVIFGCGTGNPFFSTDTAAALRAAEIEADIFFKATMVDGVYDKDPHKYPDAVKYDTLTFADILAKGLQVMDSTAAAMCKDNNIPILVFDLARPDNIYDACMGENIGTLVK